jgi:hypothetical protein
LNKSFLAFGMALAVLSGSANAGLLNNEAVTGDVAAWYANGGAALGNVKSGDYVLGNVDSNNGSAVWDGYNFTLNGTVSNINIVALTGTVSNGWQLYNGAGWGSQLRSGNLSALNAPLVFNVAGLTGTYTLGNNGIGGGVNYNYQISFDVAKQNDVPEPGIVALMGLGFAGLCAMRRRKG